MPKDCWENPMTKKYTLYLYLNAARACEVLGSEHGEKAFHTYINTSLSGPFTKDIWISVGQKGFSDLD